MISCAQAGLIGPPQGFQKYATQNKAYALLIEPGGGWDAQSVAYNQSPAIQSGFELVADAISDPGAYANTLSSDGIFALDTGGDSSRQLIVADIYHFALRSYYGVATFAVNDQAPVGIDPTPQTLRYSQAMTAVDLSASFTDAENDALTYAVTAGSAPSGTSVDTAGGWTGTPDTVSTGSFDLTATDIYGATGTITVTWSVIDQVAVPDIDDPGTTESAAYAQILAASLTPASLYDYDNTVPYGEVIFQSPAAGTLVDPDSTVTVTVSLGVLAELVMASALSDSFIAIASAQVAWNENIGAAFNEQRGGHFTRGFSANIEAQIALAAIATAIDALVQGITAGEEWMASALSDDQISAAIELDTAFDAQSPAIHGGLFPMAASDSYAAICIAIATLSALAAMQASYTAKPTYRVGFSSSAKSDSSFSSFISVPTLTPISRRISVASPSWTIH